MPSIHIQTQLESDTLHLPELQPLIGNDVEIVVREIARQRPAPKEEWDRFFAKYRHDLVDPAVYEEYRHFDAEHKRSGPTTLTFR